MEPYPQTTDHGKATPEEMEMMRNLVRMTIMSHEKILGLPHVDMTHKCDEFRNAYCDSLSQCITNILWCKKNKIHCEFVLGMNRLMYVVPVFDPSKDLR